MTERPETVAVGSNVLAGTDPEKIVECTGMMLEKANEWANPFGDGTAGERIVELRRNDDLGRFWRPGSLTRRTCEEGYTTTPF